MRLKGGNGQSLLELLIGIAIGVILILAGASAVGVYLRVSSQDVPYQAATFLAQELIDNVTVTAEGDWFKVANSTTSVYYLATSTSGFVVNAGRETKIVGDFTYKRYFFATSTCRVASATSDTIIACPGGEDDPSTKKVNVTVEWQYKGSTTTVALEKYVTRTSNFSIWQTDWVGGAVCSGSYSDSPVSDYNTRYCSSTPDTNVIPGSLKIIGF